MKELVVEIICWLGAWVIFLGALGLFWRSRWRESQWLEKLVVLGVPILLGVSAGMVTRNWAIALASASPLEWFVYIEILDWVFSRYWRKPEWVATLLDFGAPVLLGVGVYLVSHSWFVGLIYGVPWASPSLVIAIWAGGQLVREKARPTSQRE